MTYGIAEEIGGKNDRTHNRVNAERENEREEEIMTPDFSLKIMCGW